MTNIETRIQNIAERRVDKTASFCAARKAERVARVRILTRILTWEYLDLQDSIKEQWLNEQERT